MVSIKQSIFPDTHIKLLPLTHTHVPEQEQSLLSINEKYADGEEDSKSVVGELKSVLVSYTH